jgi:serine/threonine protein kinase
MIVSCVHTCYVLHKHMNSHNVLITDERRAVLTDFGLSRTASTITSMTSSTKSSFSGGTLAWTAPEIFNETDATSNFTASSDVYSYGVLIYEVLSGACPVSQNSGIRNSGTDASSIPW